MVAETGRNPRDYLKPSDCSNTNVHCTAYQTRTTANLWFRLVYMESQTAMSKRSIYVLAIHSTQTSKTHNASNVLRAFTDGCLLRAFPHQRCLVHAMPAPIHTDMLGLDITHIASSVYTNQSA